MLLNEARKARMPQYKKVLAENGYRYRKLSNSLGTFLHILHKESGFQVGGSVYSREQLELHKVAFDIYNAIEG